MHLFYVQATFSATALAFTMCMLIRGEDPGTYLPLFTSIVSYWLPSPISKPRSGTSNGRTDVESGWVNDGTSRPLLGS